MAALAMAALVLGGRGGSGAACGRCWGVAVDALFGAVIEAEGSAPFGVVVAAAAAVEEGVAKVGVAAGDVARVGVAKVGAAVEGETGCAAVVAAVSPAWVLSAAGGVAWG